MRTYPSPWFTVSLIFGIILCAIAPPAGLLIIVFGFCVQRKNTGRLRHEHNQKVEKVLARHQAARDAAGRWAAS